VDAGAALRPAPIEVQLGKWIYTIPALPAADWIEAILDDDGGAIVPGLMDEDTAYDVWREFLRGNIAKEELEQAWRYAVGAAAGQPWWQAARLVMSATNQGSWPTVHGRLTMRGVDLAAVSLGAFYNVVYFIGLESCKDDAERTTFEFQLTTPPPEVAAEDALAEFDAAGDFLAAMGAFQAFQSGEMPGPAG
jgi:hypothetical protein